VGVCSSGGVKSSCPRPLCSRWIAKSGGPIVAPTLLVARELILLWALRSSVVLECKRPTAAQFVLLYGRRRVGKTILLRHWAAEKEPAALQRRKLFAHILGVEPAQAATFDSWASCWQAIAAFLADRRHILILDEFTYAVESNPAMLSSLQHAWDQHFKHSQIVLVLCGSHVHTMETLQTRQSPLFGRLSAQW